MVDKPVYPRRELVLVAPLDPNPMIAGDMFYDHFSAWVEGVARRSSDVKIASSGSDAMPRTLRRMVLWRDDDRDYRRITYRLILRETEERVATIIGKGGIDELFVRTEMAQPGSSTIGLEWEPEGETFVEDLLYMLHQAVGVPLPDWLEAPGIYSQNNDEVAAPQDDEAAEPQSGQRGHSGESGDGAKRGMKLGTAGRVREMHRLLKSGRTYRQAKKAARCDPSTYFRWCKEVTEEEPILPYR